jgi:hypothetical protein
MKELNLKVPAFNRKCFIDFFAARKIGTPLAARALNVDFI